MNKNIQLGSRWFAIKKEDGQGIEHQIVAINKGDGDEEGDTLTEPEITTYSLYTCEKTKEGFTWVGGIAEFEKRFKFIGFSKK